MICRVHVLCFAPSDLIEQVLGERHESFGFSQENLPQLQNYPPPWRGSCDLYRSTPQTASGLIVIHELKV
jgi:hypothetical protein